MHLLEKEPDHRYQTADGVVHDLERLRDGPARVRGWRALRVGERDVPLRLLPPSRLVGRDERGGGAAGRRLRRRWRAGAGGCWWRGAGGGQDGAGR